MQRRNKSGDTVINEVLAFTQTVTLQTLMVASLLLYSRAPPRPADHSATTTTTLDQQLAAGLLCVRKTDKTSIKIQIEYRRKWLKTK